MRKLIQVIKSIKLRQILTVFLVSSLLIVSTACSQGNVAKGGRPASDTYDKYDDYIWSWFVLFPIIYYSCRVVVGYWFDFIMFLII